VADEPTAPSASDGSPRDFQLEADQHLEQLTAGLSADEKSLALSVLLNRVATRLHNLARGESAERKGAADWPSWAQLQNASRTIVLQASTCRDLAARLAGRRR
jgi:hypothetical protein